MPKYRIVAGSFTQIVGGQTKVFVAGTSNDVVELTEITAKRLGPTFALVNEVGSEDIENSEGNESSGGSNANPYREFLSHSAEEIEALLATMHDPVVLAEIHTMEKEKGEKARPEVLEAIDERYDELQEEHSKA